MKKRKMFRISEIEQFLNEWGIINSIAWDENVTKKEAESIISCLNCLNNEIKNVRKDVEEIRSNVQEIHDVFKIRS